MLCSFEQKERNDINNTDINNIIFIMFKCNEKLIVKSIDFLAQPAILKFSLQIT